MNAAHHDSERLKAILMLVATSFLWSFGGILIKWVDWNPLAIAGMRSAIAGLLILCVMGRPKFNWTFAEIGGGIAYSITTICFVSSTKLTTAANAILLQYTAPIYVALFSSWFLGEKVSRFDWGVIGAVFCGMGLFFFDKLSFGNIWGNIIAILAGMGFAATALFMRKQKHASPLQSILLGNIINVIICLPFMTRGFPDLKGWTGLLLLGVFQLGISYVLYARAVKHTTALDLILIPVIEPLLNPVWVYFLIGEKPGGFAIVGGIIILFAVTLRGVVIVTKETRASVIGTEVPIVEPAKKIIKRNKAGTPRV